MAAPFEEEMYRAGSRPQPTPEQMDAMQFYLNQANTPSPQTMYPGMISGYNPPPGESGIQSGVMRQAARAWELRRRDMGQPTTPLSVASPQGFAQGAAQQFMGVPGQGKVQDRMPMFGGPQPGVKGDPWQAPGGASRPPQGGVGAASAQPQGPLTLQGVMQSLAQANPDMMKTKEGRITLGMAALKFAPLMHQQDQMEMQRMKMELSDQVQMLKLQQGEVKLGMQEARLEAYQAKGGTKEDKLQKAYDTTAKQADTLANHMAANPNSKELKARYEATMSRLKSIEDQINPPEPSTAYADWIKGNPNKVEESIPADVRRILNPQEFKELIERQRTDPENAYARVQWLRQKTRGKESTAEKSYGNY